MTSPAALPVPGEPAPDFVLTDARGMRRALSDYRGGAVILYFYPAAFTPGCTTEACDFRENLASLQGAGYTVLGVSPDPVARLSEFAETERLSFPLLSDEGARVAKAWGAWGQKTRDGQISEGLLRTTAVIDADGVLQSLEYRVDPNGHVARLRDALGI
ncbi:peroxiredoxin [Microterricola pindariensis]|uniref:thioredoxin-dependent peroxiredoxin n=1 Tax=Microterricola pindariensis TaxID=478010 RepID=A0ABX5AZW8_9MICO|nr:peroxiredoxin [Microterricola pindariensis]PPL20018.1 peroxiredoxin [Microterricola pindariensis]